MSDSSPIQKIINAISGYFPTIAYSGGLLWAAITSGYSPALFSQYIQPNFISASSCTAPTADPTPPAYPALYNAALTWAANYSASQVRMVVIKKELTKVQQNVCYGRSYLASLVRAVDSQHPAVIVLDKYFIPEACPEDSPETKDLLAAINAASGPVIVGESTTTSQTETDQTCLTQEFQLPISGSLVQHGLLELNVNKEQIPLQWSVLPRDASKSGAPVYSQKTLAYLSAFAAAPDLAPHLQALLHQPRAPFAQFSKDLPQPESSQDVLCRYAGSNLQSGGKLSCGTTPRATASLLGKVVVIGAENTADQWPAAGQQLWGFQLQAHYINALLTGSYLQNSSLTVIALCLTAFLGGIYLPELTKLFSRARWKWSPRHARNWKLCYPIAFIVLTIVVFLSAKYLPPLSLLFTILMTWLPVPAKDMGKAWQARRKKSTHPKPKHLGASA